MKIKEELTSAFQLLGLLCLLFWSFTWNLSNNYDWTETQKSLKIVSKNCPKNVYDIESLKNVPGAALESFKTVKYIGSNNWKLSTTNNPLPPTFNAWKEEELNKQVESEKRDKIPVPKTSKRKLNYASSKCGAKILASNRETKYGKSILNEKVDEYMLNPCRIKAWFIIELCDTIEASQIELANYELYSSSPKEFSVFWSNIYPTQTWNHLGTFEARNQRSMQTFPLTLRNLGKFIKVIIFGHHGKEHYCPLSVFRVIGYSMVYEYDEIEEENEHGDLNKRTKTNGTDHVKLKEVSQNSITKNSNNTETNVTKEKIWKEETSQLTKLCYIRRKYCSYSQFEDTSLNQPACLFYRKIILRKEHICDNIWASEMPEPSFISTNENKLNSSIHSKNLNSTSNRLIVDETMKKSKEFTSFFNISSFYKKLFEQSGNSFDKHKMNRTSEDSHSSNIKSSQISMDSSNYTSLNNYNTSKNNPRAKIDDKLPKKEEHFISQNNNNVHDSTKRSCNCPEVVKNAEVTLPKQNTNWTETLLSDPSKQGSVDSATLIQKESVLVKLNMRLKESEANLNLINRYLQQLSESYRKQVEDMLSMFYGAVKAVRATSDKADMINEQQQSAIEELELKVYRLNMKVQLLEAGQNDILKRVLELHGFFLVLEIIIMSTIFSIFFNKFKRNEYYIK